MEHTAHKASRGGNSYVTLTKELHAWETDGNVGNIPAYSVEYTTQEASRGGNSYHITLNNELHAWETDIYVHIVGYLELAALSIRGETPFALHKL